MRKSLLIVPIVLTLGAPLTAPAEDAPRVLFCAGGCFAVDAKGVRTPAPKGTVLRPGQRLETAAGAYAQVKLSPAAAVGISEQASIRLDQNVVVLDQGRVRMVGGEAFGKPITQPIELRTIDGTVVLRGADIEAKKLDMGTTTPTLVKVNAGDARLGRGAGEIQLPTQGVQGISTGKLAGAPIPITDIVPPTKGADAPARPRLPVSIASAPLDMPTLPVLRTDRLTPVLDMRRPILTAPPVKPALLPGERILVTEFKIGDRKTSLAEVIENPTVFLGSVTLAPTTSPTTTTTTISPTLLETTVLQSPTYTFQVSSELTKTTTTTTLTTTTSPTLTTSTTTSPILLSPTTTLISPTLR